MGQFNEIRKEMLDGFIGTINERGADLAEQHPIRWKIAKGLGIATFHVVLVVLGIIYIAIVGFEKAKRVITRK